MGQKDDGQSHVVIRVEKSGATVAGLVSSADGGIDLLPSSRNRSGHTQEAPVSHARVRRAGLKHVWVRPGHDVGHHAAGGETHNIDTRPVRGVLVDGVVDHVDDAEGVAALSVR